MAWLKSGWWFPDAEVSDSWCVGTAYYEMKDTPTPCQWSFSKWSVIKTSGRSHWIEIFPVSGRKDTSHQTHLSGLRGNQPAPVHLEKVFVHNKLKWIKVNNQQKSSNESKIPAHSANLRICSVGLAAGRQERGTGWQLADTRPSCRRVVLYTAIPRHMDNHRQSRQHCSSTHTVSRQWTQTNQSISQWYYSTITMAMHLNYKLYK